MYLGFRSHDNQFIVCLEGTQVDIKRVKETSTYFNDLKFETLTMNQLKRRFLVPVTKSGMIIKQTCLVKEGFR